MPDAHKNFAYSTVATAPSPATSGTSLVVATGDGAKFPTPPFNATIWPASSQPLASNAEIVRVTAISTDTLTIVRAQESSTARSVGTGDQIAATITTLEFQVAEHYSGLVCSLEQDFLGSGFYTGGTANGGGTSAIPGLQIVGHPGIYQLTSGVTAGGLAFVSFAANANNGFQPLNTNDALWEVEAIFQMPSVMTDTDIRIGLSNLAANVALTTGVCLEKLAADTNLFLKVMNNSTADARQDTGFAPTANAWVQMIVGRSGTSQVCYSINRAAATYYTATNMPGSSPGIPFVGLWVNGTASSRSLNVDYLRFTETGLSR